MMNQKKWQATPIAVSLTLTGLCLGSVGILKPLITPGIASEIYQSPSHRPIAHELNLQLPPKGAPGQRRGSGTRGNRCITALVPGTNLGLTVAERPTFWFYIGYKPASYECDQVEAEFLLKNWEGNEFYKQVLNLENTPGIVAISLPETVSSLEFDQLYSWSFEIMCWSQFDYDLNYVYGGIERIPMSPELESQLKDKTERERIAIYAENGFWFDVLTMLAELRGANSQDESLDEVWVELLEQVGLEEIGSEPLVDCCTSEE